MAWQAKHLHLVNELNKNKNSRQAEILQRFFKTKKGEYGQGDLFLGIKVPLQRKIARKYSNLSLFNLQKLFNSKIHEHRLCALLILTDQYKKNPDKRKFINFYLKNSKKVNNWDLVDLSAPKILGDYLLDKDKKILYKYAKSDNLWQKRIAIISTYTFIINNELEDTIRISKILLNDDHDLIHKAVGWMLRELGKKNQSKLEDFLTKYASTMPRVMLRYSIEKLSPQKRKYYLSLKNK